MLTAGGLADQSHDRNHSFGNIPRLFLIPGHQKSYISLADIIRSLNCLTPLQVISLLSFYVLASCLIPLFKLLTVQARHIFAH